MKTLFDELTNKAKEISFYLNNREDLSTEAKNDIMNNVILRIQDINRMKGAGVNKEMKIKIVDVMLEKDVSRLIQRYTTK